MERGWEEGSPLYQQIQERLITGIVQGLWKPGDNLPSVRQVAVELQVNPLTVSRAFRELVDDGIALAQRGQAMVVAPQADVRLREQLLQRFWAEEWPRWQARLQLLGLTLNDLSHPPVEPSP